MLVQRPTMRRIVTSASTKILLLGSLIVKFAEIVSYEEVFTTRHHCGSFGQVSTVRPNEVSHSDTLEVSL